MSELWDKANKRKVEYTYRLVSDFGFGDKSWIERGLSEKDALNKLIEHGYCRKDITIEEALDLKGDSIYYLEIDDFDDVEDWDWMDS
jgi:hypothetical protein